MELKPRMQRSQTKIRSRLLIVPYGIETFYRKMSALVPFCLLIVPYGIETKGSAGTRRRAWLLIVPYGIETFLYLCRHLD